MTPEGLCWQSLHQAGQNLMWPKGLRGQWSIEGRHSQCLSWSLLRGAVSLVQSSHRFPEPSEGQKAPCTMSGISLGRCASPRGQSHRATVCVTVEPPVNLGTGKQETGDHGSSHCPGKAVAPNSVSPGHQDTAFGLHAWNWNTPVNRHGTASPRNGPGWLNSLFVTFHVSFPQQLLSLQA